MELILTARDLRVNKLGSTANTKLPCSNNVFATQRAIEGLFSQRADLQRELDGTWDQTSGFEGEQRELDRGQERGLLNAMQGFQGDESAAERTHQTGLQGTYGQRSGHDATMQQDQREFLGQEGQAERDLEQLMGGTYGQRSDQELELLRKQQMFQGGQAGQERGQVGIPNAARGSSNKVWA